MQEFMDMLIIHLMIMKKVEMWKAKVIYTNKDTKEKIIVYDNKFLYLDININYDEKNITLIKNKLLNL